MTTTELLDKALTPINAILERKGQDYLHQQTSLLFFTVLAILNASLIFIEGNTSSLSFYVHMPLALFAIYNFGTLKRDQKKYTKLCNRDLNTPDDLTQIYQDLTTFFKRKNLWIFPLLALLLTLFLFNIFFPDHLRNMFSYEKIISGSISIWLYFGLIVSVILFYILINYLDNRKYKKNFGSDLDEIKLILDYLK